MTSSTKDLMQWAVIGAGPAGIATVGKLIDIQIDAKKIAWVDPHFRVGDFGQLWRSVPSNTRVVLFQKFLAAVLAFRYAQKSQAFTLDSLDPDATCELKHMAEPLQWVSDHLQETVNNYQTQALRLNLKNRIWEITTEQQTIYAKNVVLATGAEPINLDYPNKTIIDIPTTMDLNKLAKQVNANDTVGVFGASHTAILVLANLLQCPVKKVINFYRSPLKYAVYLENEIMFDDTGLKGNTAVWARENIDGQWPERLDRMLLTDPRFSSALNACNKVVYAVGFKARALPSLEQFGSIAYNDHNGIIAPGLFGFGIAFPQAKTDRFGNVEHRVGLWKFINYLNDILPIWLRYPA